MAESKKKKEPVKQGGKANFPRAEKVIVFIVAYVIAVSLWLLVNLGRDYTLNVRIPIEIAQLADDVSLADEPPAYTTVSIFGEGWKLLNIYNNPPAVLVDASDGVSNLAEIVQENIGSQQDVVIQKVQPGLLNLNIEERVSKMVPVIPRVSVDFRSQFDFVGSPRLIPDSVRITGAASRVQNITEWRTRTIELSDVKDNLFVDMELERGPDIIHLNTNRVVFQADVSEYTEGEIRVFIRAEGLPENREVRFNPSVISIKYDVPLEEYAPAQEIVPYKAFVPYADLAADTTGFISPIIAPTTDELNLKLRSYQPRRVSYYEVIRD